jgi:hypothetical protein
MYDEPTAGLDPVASTVVEDLVRSLRVSHTTKQEADGVGTGESGGIAAYIVVTHQHSTIRRSVDRIIFLHEVPPSLFLCMQPFLFFSHGDCPDLGGSHFDCCKLFHSPLMMYLSLVDEGEWQMIRYIVVCEQEVKCHAGDGGVGGLCGGI